MKMKYLAIALLGFLFVACQQTPKQEAHQENEYRFEGLMVEDEIDVLTSYAANTRLSIQLADAAVQDADSERVRTLASTMAKDHRQLYSELEELAAVYNMALPAGLSEEQMETLNMLKSKSGKEFDKTYIDMVLSYHNAFSDKMENIIKEATHESMMDFARLVDSHHYVHMNEAKALKMELDA